MSNNSQFVWVKRGAEFPNTCITCGMFTDRRVTVRFVGTRLEQYETSGDGSLGLGCILFLLGPLGLLIGLINSMSRGSRRHGEIREREVSVKRRIKIPQCDLCSSENKLTAVDGDCDEEIFAFDVHPRFAESYQRMNPNEIANSH